MLAQRILGPNHKRLLIVKDDEQTNPAEPMPQGLIRQSIATKLLDAGWRYYTGPGTARAGWYVAGSDPDVHPIKAAG